MYKECEEDIKALLKIAEEQDNKLNLSLIAITAGRVRTVDELEKILEIIREQGIEVTTDDVEPDDINNVSDNVIPFDPSKIDIKMDKLTMDSLIRRIRFDEIEFQASFQRKSGLWRKPQKSQLIESILLKIPLPAFYFDATDDNKWLIIDGLQRLSTIKEFVVEESFELKGLEFMTDLDGIKYSKLPRSLQRRIDETNINAYLINPATPKNVKYNIFKRINTGGLVLEPQEIRNALFQGQATESLLKMSKVKEFTLATDGSIKSDRKLDCEFCLRYIVFTQLLDSYSGNMDDFLSNGMEYLQKISLEEFERIKAKFKETMTIAYDIFKKNCFRKVFGDGRRRPINKAIFEAVSYVVFKSSKEKIEEYIKNKCEINQKYMKLCSEDYDFQNYLKASDKKSVEARIGKIKEIFNDI